jgi:hypothetical protein
MATTMPKPCERYSKRMPLNEKFVEHLPNCAECKAVLAYLDWFPAMRLWLHRHRT